MGFRDWFRRKPEPRRTMVPMRRSVFAGAQEGRLFQDWIASWMSAEDENRFELRLLRTRSREQSRNNPLARRYLGLVDENVLGPDGLVLQARTMLASGDPDEETNGAIERAWDEWGEPGVCTADGKQCWREFTGAALEAVARDGEALVELLPGFPNAFGFAVRLHDADLLDEQYNVAAREGQNAIVAGVEIDQYGREVAFHLWTRHPAATLPSGDRKRVRIEAGRMLHLGHMRRVGQVRYEPWLTPVLVPLRMLDEYLGAELVAARAGSENLGFITKNEQYAGPDPNAPDLGQSLMQTAKGTVQELNVGEGITFWDANHPNQVLPSFVREIKAQIAAGLLVSYASLTGDMSQSNYSSSRLALNGERDMWRIKQRWLAEALCEPVYRAWLRQAVIWQQVRLPGRVADLQDAEWVPRGFEYVDPEKDIDTDLKAVASGTYSLTRMCAAKGLELRQVLMERKAEIALAAEMGVPIEMATAMTQRPQQDTPGQPSGSGAAGAPESPAEDTGEGPETEAETETEGAANGG